MAGGYNPTTSANVTHLNADLTKPTWKTKQWLLYASFSKTKIHCVFVS